MRAQNYNVVGNHTPLPVETFRLEHKILFYFVVVVVVVDICAHIYFCTYLFSTLYLVIFSACYVKTRYTSNRKQTDYLHVSKDNIFYYIIVIIFTHYVFN